MRLLITTQAVDLDDPILGFFHRWIEELAKQCDSVEVICLKEGKHQLPANVRVHSLGKERGRSRIKYIFNFYRYLWAMRGTYDAVFVHMNSEYVCLGAPWWRLSGKRVVLWRNHKLPGFSTWLAVHFSDAVCYTSPSAYVARFLNSMQMPVGIDTEFFRPGAVAAEANSILFLGRLDEVKHPDIFVRALELVYEHLSGKGGIQFRAIIVGDPTEPDSPYAHALRDRATTFALEGALVMRRGVQQSEARAFFASCALYVNLTPSGSFDKTIAEAASSGCVIVAGNEVVRGIVPDTLMVDPLSPRDVARGIEAALALSQEQRAAIVETLRRWVVREHSLTLLIQRLATVLREKDA